MVTTWFLLLRYTKNDTEEMETMPDNNPYEGIQEFVAQLPELLQPLLVALLAMIPYFEAEGATALGILAGVHPIVAALGAASGNILIVIGVVLLGSRIRERAIARRAVTNTELPDEDKPTRTSKGRQRLRRWMVRFGVPGASILAPIALPTHLTAAFFVASGVDKKWVILWQVIAIVLWTAAVAAAATGVVSLLGW